MGITGGRGVLRRVARVGRATVGPTVLVVLLSSGSFATTATTAATQTSAASDAVPRCEIDRTHRAAQVDTMAVVRSPRGKVRVVSFERGWAVYNGQAPGTFLRVCRA